MRKKTIITLLNTNAKISVIVKAASKSCYIQPKKI